MFYMHLFPHVMYMSADSIVNFTNQQSVLYIFLFALHFSFAASATFYFMFSQSEVSVRNHSNS